MSLQVMAWKKKNLQGMSLLAHETLLFLIKVYELKINIQNRQEPHVNEPYRLKCTAAQMQVCLSIDSVVSDKPVYQD